ncbi:MAG TPA: hypothetical protein VLX92_12830 [Kofleriaceae bacterium]|nr:hypothetical protein [Kofleriaceae bacterium]
MVDDNPTTHIWPRAVNLIAGVWLFISAFVWPHTMGELTDTWIVGVLIAIASIWALYTPAMRFANTVLSIWLFFSTLVIAHTVVATTWNNLIAAIVVFVMSLTPSGDAALMEH